jgi:hypothetical protein
MSGHHMCARTAEMALDCRDGTRQEADTAEATASTGGHVSKQMVVLARTNSAAWHYRRAPNDFKLQTLYWQGIEFLWIYWGPRTMSFQCLKNEKVA